MQAVKPNINEVITRFYFELCNENNDDDELDVVDFLKVTEILRATVFHTGSITENGNFVPNKVGMNQIHFFAIQLELLLILL